MPNPPADNCHFYHVLSCLATTELKVFPGTLSESESFNPPKRGKIKKLLWQAGPMPKRHGMFLGRQLQPGWYPYDQCGGCMSSRAHHSRARLSRRREGKWGHLRWLRGKPNPSLTAGQDPRGPRSSLKVKKSPQIQKGILTPPKIYQGEVLL